MPRYLPFIDDALRPTPMSCVPAIFSSFKNLISFYIIIYFFIFYYFIYTIFISYTSRLETKSSRISSRKLMVKYDRT